MKSVFVFLMLLIIQPAHSGCDWTKNKNKHTPHAEIRIAFRTLERCKEGCEKDPLCDQGIDYWPAANQCYFSVNGVVRNFDGLDHYNCLRPRRGCDWTKHKDKHLPVGDIQLAFRTLERCKEGCEKDRHCDKGFDYWDAAKQCYFSRSGVLTNFDGIDHYFCSRPGGYVPRGRCVWTRHKDKNTQGGEIQGAFRTLERCKEGCEKDLLCDQGFDYLIAYNQCYFSRHGLLSNYVGVDHYFCSRPVENLPSKGCIWTKHKDKHLPVGDQQTAFRTLERCMEGCEKDPHCDKGFDYWPHVKQCYFSRNGVLSNYGGLDHYSCSKNCKWRISPEMHAAGKPAKIHYDLEFWVCAVWCIIEGVEICAGFDYIPPINNQRETCNLIGKDNVDKLHTHESSAHVAKDCGCLWKYKGKSGKRYHYLRTYADSNTPKTLETCQSECLENFQCHTGIHWDPKKEECYFGADFTTSFDNWSITDVHKEFDHYLCEF